MKNLEKIIDKIDGHMGDKEKVRDEALRCSRDIITCCRRAIQRMHQSEMGKASDLIEEASKRIVSLQKLTRSFPDLFHAGFVENASQEFVEASCLFAIIKGDDLPDPDSLHTTYSSYLLGLCDVVGELRRATLDFILEGEPVRANEYLALMDEIYDAIMGFDYPSGLVPIKKKQDMVRGMIERTRSELAVASCERRIDDRANEFRGMIDELNGGAKKKSKKKRSSSSPEIDIDKVW